MPTSFLGHSQAEWFSSFDRRKEVMIAEIHHRSKAATGKTVKRRTVDISLHRPHLIGEPHAKAKVLLDEQSGLLWASHLSKRVMSFQAVPAYLEALRIDGIGGWRLPSVEELTTIMDPDLLAKAKRKDYDAFPICPPFEITRTGYVFTSSRVFPERFAPDWERYYYVLNIRNGHRFNGVPGVNAYVLAVTNPPGHALPVMEQRSKEER